MIKYAFGFVTAFMLWVLVLSMVPMPTYRVYDCGMAEWHPDIPPKVKEECRNRNLENRKKQDENKIQTNVYEDRKSLRGSQPRT